MALKTKWLKTSFNVFAFLFIFCMLIFVHELGHCIVANLVGGECLEIGITNDMSAAYCRCRCYTREQWLIVSVAGSTFGVLVSILLGALFNKLDYFAGTNACCLYLIGELFYWMYSPFAKFGDAYMLFTLTEFDAYISYYVLMITLLIILLIKYFYFINKHIEEVSKKCRKKI